MSGYFIFYSAFMAKGDFRKIKEEKTKTKETLFKKSWPQESLRVPLLVVFDPEKHQHKDILFKLMEGLAIMPIRVIVVSKSEMPDMSKHPSGKVFWVNTEDGRNQPLLNNYMLAADMALLFEEHYNEIEDLMKKGAVIVGHEKSPLLENYHPNNETGNSFTFSHYNPWDIFSSLVRAVETYRFPYDWDNIVRNMVKKGQA
jgi:hypothetical protein